MLENPIALIKEPPTIQEFNKILKVQGADKTSDHEEQMKAQEVEESTKINEQPKFQDLNAWGGNVMIQTNNGVKHWDSMQSGVLMRISMCKRYRCGRCNEETWRIFCCIVRWLDFGVMFFLFGVDWVISGSVLDHVAGWKWWQAFSEVWNLVCLRDVVLMEGEK
uniref:Uncharacterized protein n=1 Tax=Fagus sylvatica TaxID=28930 RepID=A0A2N9GJA1_FAGSY